MPLLNIADIFTPATQPSVLSLELAICAQLGLPTTAWQPLTPEMVILGVNAQLSATYSLEVVQIAQGGFGSSASTIVAPTGSDPTTVDSGGFLTTWMDLIAANNYDISRIPATFATGAIPVSNTSGTTYNYSPSAPLHFMNRFTGLTYTTTGTGTVPPGATNIPVQADQVGHAGTLPAGNIPILLTPLSGVSPTAVVTSLIGLDAESNVNLFGRCIAKLGALSPNGSQFSYQFVATSLPTPATAATAPFPFNVAGITVSTPITRVATFLGTLTGAVGVYVANSAGAPSGADVSAVANAIQLFCVPLAITATVAPVGTLPLNLNFNVYVKTSSGLAAVTILNNIDTAIAAYCSSVPIGGFTTPKQANYIPYDELVDVIFNANPGTVDLQLLNPGADLAIAPTSVPVPGTRIAGPANVFLV